MATMIIMPKSGQSVESCIIAKWHKKKGDSVKKGEILFTYETDKASFEKEAECDGILLEIFYEEGDDVACLENVCAIGHAGEKIDNIKAIVVNEVEERTEISLAVDVTDRISHAIEHKPRDESEKILISPRAKRLAKKASVDIRCAIGTGASERIIERDIKDLIRAGCADDIEYAHNISRTSDVKQMVSSGIGFEFVKHSNIRKIIAKSTHSSLSTMAQLTMHSSFDATDILGVRAKVKKLSEKIGAPNITITDLILYACSRTLIKHKNINAHYQDDGMKLFNSVNLGVAVDTERGLLVPTIFNAEIKTLTEISTELKNISSEAKAASINPERLQNATFTITTLGSLGIEMFTPVINPPQVAILGVCSMTNKLRDDGAIYKSMGLSLTIDHRAVDGAPAARFLADLIIYLENFSVMGMGIL